MRYIRARSYGAKAIDHQSLKKKILEYKKKFFTVNKTYVIA